MNDLLQKEIPSYTPIVIIKSLCRAKDDLEVVFYHSDSDYLLQYRTGIHLNIMGFVKQYVVHWTVDINALE